jgi:hypothetical protein
VTAATIPETAVAKNGAPRDLCLAQAGGNSPETEPNRETKTSKRFCKTNFNLTRIGNSTPGNVSTSDRKDGISLVHRAQQQKI